MNKEWTDDELYDAVAAYVDMFHKQQAGVSIIKKRYYEKLSDKHGRSKKAFEYRMCNISYVFSLMGKDIVNGLLPACNIGPKNFKKIAAFATQLLQTTQPSELDFEYTVRQELAEKIQICPLGNSQPQSIEHTTKAYVRDPKVKAWVLRRANGVCELCKQPAPFTSIDGLPYLEAHHVRPLAEGSPDTPDNTVAVCPNCHRELHFGKDRKTKEAILHATILQTSKA